jgi:hypothetical protein
MANREEECAVSEKPPPKPTEPTELTPEELEDLEIERKIEELNRQTDEAMKAIFGKSLTPPKAGKQ